MLKKFSEHVVKMYFKTAKNFPEHVVKMYINMLNFLNMWKFTSKMLNFSEHVVKSYIKNA